MLAQCDASTVSVRTTTLEDPRGKIRLLEAGIQEL